MKPILFYNISELITNSGVMKKQGVLVQEQDLGIITNGALLWDKQHGILWMGKTKSIPASLKKSAQLRNLSGKILTPALADCHTHLVFSGSRHNEFAMRLSGSTYQEIAKSGGGIKSSVKMTKKASQTELFLDAQNRIKKMQKLGVGLLEIKSGYGMDWDTEIKMLSVIAKLKKKFQKNLTIQSTYLGAHDFPLYAKSETQRCGYVDNLVDKFLPQISKLKIADACDVFCDQGYYNAKQAERILLKAKSLGLKIKLHADELADVDGAALSARLHALSADHLLKANFRGLQAMGKSNVAAVLLPGTAFYLGLKYASVEKMRKAKVCMALATDYNPGSSPILNLPFIMSLACLQMGMSLNEAFAAATYGGARAMGLHQSHGFLKVRKKPRIAIFNCPSYKALISQVADTGLCEAVL